MSKYVDISTFKMEDFKNCLDCDSILEVIKYHPKADVAPIVHAHWESDAEDEHWCSHCNSMIEDSTALEFTDWGSQYICLDESSVPLDFVQWDGNELPMYCPHCGAKMDEKLNDDSFQKIERCPYCNGVPELKNVGDNKQFLVYECKDCFKTPVKNDEARLTEYGARLIWNKRAKEAKLK